MIIDYPIKIKNLKKNRKKNLLKKKIIKLN